MKCYRHLGEDALYDCAICGRPICAACMTFGEESDRITCPECAGGGPVLPAGGKSPRGAAPVRVEKNGGMFAGIRVNPRLLFVLAALIGLNMLLGARLDGAPPPAGFGDAHIALIESPAPQFTWLLSRIFAYRHEHGEYPRTLADLRPEYLDSEPRILRSAEIYHYVREASGGFVLSVPRAARFGFVNLYADPDGVVRIE
ncbi:hypothetical protein K8I61_05540 [bacterium]|nr:hypothetical protein [bacterium]